MGTAASAVRGAKLDESLLNPFRVMFLKHCPQGRRRAVRHGMDVLNQRINIRGRHQQVSNQPGAWIPIRVRRASRHKTAEPATASTTSFPTRTHNVPSRTYQASSSLRWRCREAIHRGGPGGPPASFHSATTKFAPTAPTTFPASGGAAMGELMLKCSNSTFRSSPTSPLPVPTSPAWSGRNSPPPADQPRRSTPL